jgi:hypothetical protein
MHMRPTGVRGNLPDVDAALLEFLRDRGKYSELDPGATIARLKEVFVGATDHKGLSIRRLQRLRSTALQEPPRVRAMLGAILEFSGISNSIWGPLMSSLNPSSRFEFGLFRDLPNASKWLAR